MALAEQFGGPVFADSFKFRTDEPDFGLDFGGDIEADACAAPVVGQMISGYESDDEGVDDIVTIKKNLRERSSNREAGLKPDVEEDSRTSQLVQTGIKPLKIISAVLNINGEADLTVVIITCESDYCNSYQKGKRK